MGEKKMPKKDRKSKTIYHNSKDISSDKAYANARKKETVDVKWETTPSWTVMSYNPNNTDTSNNYKLFTDNKEDDGE